MKMSFQVLHFTYTVTTNMENEIQSQITKCFPMQNGLMRWGICSYLKITQYREDAQETYLDVSKRKKHSS